MPGAKSNNLKVAIECKHIDNDRLYTDPVYRFQYLSEFCDFGDEDIAAIHAAAPAVAPLVPAIVDAVYEKLFSFDTTKSVFLQRNEGFQGKLPTDLNHLSLDNEQIRFRKDFLGKYLTKLVTAKYDANFVMYLDYVGKIHTAYSGKASRINVEYVHCSALFAFVTSFVVNALMSAGLPHDVEKMTILAFNKLLWIQNDFFAKWYVRDGPHSAGSESASFLKSGTAWMMVSAVSVVVAAFSWMRTIN